MCIAVASIVVLCGADVNYPGALVQGEIAQQTAAVKIVECSVLQDQTLHWSTNSGKDFPFSAVVFARFRLLDKRRQILADEIVSVSGDGFGTLHMIGAGGVFDPADISSLQCSLDRISLTPGGDGRNQWLQVDSDLLQCPDPIPINDSGAGINFQGLALGRDWVALSVSGYVNTFLAYPRSTLQDDPFFVLLDRSSPFGVLLSDKSPNATVFFDKLKPGAHQIAFGSSSDATGLPNQLICFRTPR